MLAATDNKDIANEMHAFDSKGFSPLIHAVLSGSLDTVKIFLKQGIDPNKAIDFKIVKQLDSTPLHLAL